MALVAAGEEVSSVGAYFRMPTVVEEVDGEGEVEVGESRWREGGKWGLSRPTMMQLGGCKLRLRE